MILYSRQISYYSYGCLLIWVPLFQFQFKIILEYEPASEFHGFPLYSLITFCSIQQSLQNFESILMSIFFDAKLNIALFLARKKRRYDRTSV